ncbi:MAG: methyltransferase domain-containing protein [Promethearchaeota archaeon]
MKKNSNSFVCPICKSDLSFLKKKYICHSCHRNFNIVNSIPNFFIASESEKEIPAIKSVKFIDYLSKVYESKIWYPLVYHLYGGIKIPNIQKTVNLITEMTNSSDGIVLDVACGTGIYTRSIAKNVNKIYGIDLSQGMLEKGINLAYKNKIFNIEFLRANVERIPFSNNYFDGACCSGALHLFPNTILALKEIARVLKPNCPLAVMTFTRRRFLKYKFIYDHIKKNHGAIIFDLNELSIILKRAGFKSFKPKVFGSMLLFSAKKNYK